MRVAIVFDMEGTSHISDFREVFPVFQQYWRSGRRKLTADVVATAEGLLAGGADDVFVINHHGAGEPEWPNVIEEGLPDGVRSMGWEDNELREHVDAVFEVGSHARGGSSSFLSHTILPGLRLRCRGELLSETHWRPWTADLPLLGIVGSRALGSEIGSLRDVPYLVVQESEDRRSARSTFADPDRTASEIRSFAERAIKDGAETRSMAPSNVVLEASLQNGEEQGAVLESAGWQRTGSTEFQIEGAYWREVEDAVDVAADAAWVPYESFFGFDVSTEQEALSSDPERLEHNRKTWAAWSNEATQPDWYGPGVASHWEGLDHR